MKKIAIVMGSDSDLPVMQQAIDCLKEFSVPFEVRIISAHRTPDVAREFALSAKEEGFAAIIAAAGKAAHLGGFIAAYTTLPVIAVPIKGSAFLGFDSLLSMVQMPAGVPVATVAVDGSMNAALLAVQMLALSDKELDEKLSAYKANLGKKVIEKDEKIKSSIK